jgi:hypothetical protein
LCSLSIENCGIILKPNEEDRVLKAPDLLLDYITLDLCSLPLDLCS